MAKVKNKARSLQSGDVGTVTSQTRTLQYDEQGRLVSETVTTQVDALVHPEQEA